jgi:transcription-repair coupling factor (superfamily II helicase)
MKTSLASIPVGDPFVEEPLAAVISGADASVALPGAARGFLLAHLAKRLRQHKGGPLVVVVPDERQAYELACDILEVIGPEGSEESQAAEGTSGLWPPAEVFPAWESLPFEHISPSPDTTGVRLRVLYRLGCGPSARPDSSLSVVVASTRAVMQRIAFSALPEEPIAVGVGTVIDPEELARTLVEWGYQRVPQVEARGEFAQRGGILDVWAVGDTQPTRLDFLGDEVEAAKIFSVDTQRSVRERPGPLYLFPAREIRLSEDIRRRALELAREYPENRHIWEKFAEGVYFAGMESWLPWVEPAAEGLLARLSRGVCVAICDPAEVAERARRIVEEERDIAAALLATWSDSWRTTESHGDTPDARSSAGDAAENGAGPGSSPEFPSLYEDPDRLLRKFSGAVLRIASTSEQPSGEPAVQVWPKGLGASDTVDQISTLLSSGYFVVVCAGSTEAADRISRVLRNDGLPAKTTSAAFLSEISRAPGLVVGPFSYSGAFIYRTKHFAVLTPGELGARQTSRTPLADAAQRWDSLLARLRGDSEVASEVQAGGELDRRRQHRLEEFLADLEPGDYVVHYYHGIGLYKGIVTLSAGGVERDYLLIEYAGNAKLYVPTDQLDAVTKYSGGEHPRLSRLGGTDWNQTKSRARAAAARVAQYLVELYRDRARVSGIAFSPDTPWQRELEDSFPFELTPDQRRALEEVKADMESPRPMDRLICGDVGFGKTEIAVRAAFKAVQDGFQVAVLAPTTLLAHQHYETFRERFEPFPVKVAVLSRFLPRSKQREVIERLADGSIDVVIGTHRLLQGDVRIPKLGLLVIDEEHRFGVAHKEALKAAARHVDVLTLTATPIPRTLEMALSGIRDISMIRTPPPGRQPVLTYVGEYDEGAVAAAIRREMLRGGQVFYVYNRVDSIGQAEERLRAAAPSARYAIAHGQMSEGELEKTMVAFLEGKIDVLVTTTIVESGLDIPRVNTLIVERADLLGLAELYQLRGRVGRGRERAYAYFFYPSRASITDEAYERLKTIGEHTDLGSGFAIARKDLEIRGAGNILGEAQSGHIQAVGLDLYVQLVADAVRAMEGEPVQAELPQVTIDLPVDAYLPKDYVPKEAMRLEAYRKVAQARSDSDLDQILEEWRDRYGPVPAPAAELLAIARLKLALRQAGIEECVYSAGKLRLRPLDLSELQLVRLRRQRLLANYRPADGELSIKLDAQQVTPTKVEELLRVIAGAGEVGPRAKPKRATVKPAATQRAQRGGS